MMFSFLLNFQFQNHGLNFHCYLLLKRAFELPCLRFPIYSSNF